MWQFDIAHIPPLTFLKEYVYKRLSLIFIKSLNLFRSLKKRERVLSRFSELFKKINKTSNWVSVTVRFFKGMLILWTYSKAFAYKINVFWDVYLHHLVLRSLRRLGPFCKSFMIAKFNLFITDDCISVQLQFHPWGIIRY